MISESDLVFAPDILKQELNPNQDDKNFIIRIKDGKKFSRQDVENYFKKNPSFLGKFTVQYPKGINATNIFKIAVLKIPISKATSYSSSSSSSEKRKGKEIEKSSSSRKQLKESGNKNVVIKTRSLPNPKPLSSIFLPETKSISDVLYQMNKNHLKQSNSFSSRISEYVTLVFSYLEKDKRFINELYDFLPQEEKNLETDKSSTLEKFFASQNSMTIEDFYIILSSIPYASSDIDKNVQRMQFSYFGRLVFLLNNYYQLKSTKTSEKSTSIRTYLEPKIPENPIVPEKQINDILTTPNLQLVLLSPFKFILQLPIDDQYRGKTTSEAKETYKKTIEKNLVTKLKAFSFDALKTKPTKKVIYLHFAPYDLPPSQFKNANCVRVVIDSFNDSITFEIEKNMCRKLKKPLKRNKNIPSKFERYYPINAYSIETERNPEFFQKSFTRFFYKDFKEVIIPYLLFYQKTEEDISIAKKFVLFSGIDYDVIRHDFEEKNFTFSDFRFLGPEGVLFSSFDDLSHEREYKMFFTPAMRSFDDDKENPNGEEYFSESPLYKASPFQGIFLSAIFSKSISEKNKQENKEENEEEGIENESESEWDIDELSKLLEEEIEEEKEIQSKEERKPISISGKEEEMEEGEIQKDLFDVKNLDKYEFEILSQCLKALNIKATSNFGNELENIEKRLKILKGGTNFNYTAEKMLQIKNRSILCPQVSFRNIFLRYLAPYFPFIGENIRILSLFEKFEKPNKQQPAFVIPAGIVLKSSDKKNILSAFVFIKISFSGPIDTPSVGDLEYEAYKNVIPYIIQNEYSPHLITPYFAFYYGLGSNIQNLYQCVTHAIKPILRASNINSFEQQFSNTLPFWVELQKSNAFYKENGIVKSSLKITIAEYLDGERLDVWINRVIFSLEAPFDVKFRTLFRIIFQVVWTISVFHQLKILHNDLKLDNLSVNVAKTEDTLIYYQSKKNLFAIPTSPSNNNNDTLNEYSCVKIYDFDRSVTKYDFYRSSPGNPIKTFPKNYINIDGTKQIRSNFNRSYDLFMFLSLVQHRINIGFIGMYVDTLPIEQGNILSLENENNINQFREILQNATTSLQFESLIDFIQTKVEKSDQRSKMLSFSTEYKNFISVLNKIFSNQYFTLKTFTFREREKNGEEKKEDFITVMYRTMNEKKKIAQTFVVADTRPYNGRLLNAGDFDKNIIDIEDLLFLLGEKAQIIPNNNSIPENVKSNIFKMPDPFI